MVLSELWIMYRLNDTKKIKLCGINFMAYLVFMCRSEANDLALQIADTVTGNTEHICVEGYVTVTLPLLLYPPPSPEHTMATSVHCCR